MGEVHACQMVLRCVPVPAARCSLSSCASSSSPARTSSSRLTASRPSTCVQGRAVSHAPRQLTVTPRIQGRAVSTNAPRQHAPTAAPAAPAAATPVWRAEARPQRAQSRPGPKAERHRRPGWWAAAWGGWWAAAGVGCGRGGLRPLPADLGAIDMLEHAAGELLVGDRVLLLRVAERRARSELREARGAPGSQHRLGVLLPGVRHALDAGGRVQVGLLLGHHPHELVHPEAVGAQLGHRRDLLRSRVQV